MAFRESVEAPSLGRLQKRSLAVHFNVAILTRMDGNIYNNKIGTTKQRTSRARIATSPTKHETTKHDQKRSKKEKRETKRRNKSK